MVGVSKGTRRKACMSQVDDLISKMEITACGKRLAERWDAQDLRSVTSASKMSRGEVRERKSHKTWFDPRGLSLGVLLR